jgi:hypothetical protein
MRFDRPWLYFFFQRETEQFLGRSKRLKGLGDRELSETRCSRAATDLIQSMNDNRRDLLAKSRPRSD